MYYGPFARWNGTAYKSKNLTTEEWEKGAQICHTMKKGKSFDNTTAKCGLHSSLLRTVKKYVFFSTDKDIMANYTRQEEYIMDNNARAIPTLMQQVTALYSCIHFPCLPICNK